MPYRLFRAMHSFIIVAESRNILQKVEMMYLLEKY